MLFTIKAERVLNFAKAQSARNSHKSVYARDILLGILADSSMAAQVCWELGITYDSVQQRIEEKGIEKPASIFLSEGDEYSNILILSFEEAQRREDHHIGPEHLLLALAHDECRAPVLEELAIPRERVRTALLQVLSHH